VRRSGPQSSEDTRRLAKWTPRELRHSFVSVLSDAGIPVEQISQLVGHRCTTVTKLVSAKDWLRGTILLSVVFVRARTCLVGPDRTDR
jgi:integrase